MTMTTSTVNVSVTPGFTGADIAYTCQRAALLCVKEAAGAQEPPADIAITADHFRSAIASQGQATRTDRHTGVARASARLLARSLF